MRTGEQLQLILCQESREAAHCNNPLWQAINLL